MPWSIDNKGIHVDAFSLRELKEAIKEVEEWLKKTPRSVQEENNESLVRLQRMVS